MSTNDFEGGGSGNYDGGASSETASDGDSRLRRIVRAAVIAIVPTWVLAFQTWEQFTAFLEAFIIETVVKWIVANFVRPLVNAVLGIGGLIVDTILLVAFGTDRVLGGPPGLVDLVVWLAESFVAATSGPTDQIVTVITDFNASIAATAADAGLAAPFVVTLMWGAELAVTGYIVWSIVRVIDFPLVDVDDFIIRVTKPFRVVLRRFR